MGPSFRRAFPVAIFVLAVAPWMTSDACAEDVGAVMAALKDEKSECRYLAGLYERLSESGKGGGDPGMAIREMNRALDDVSTARGVMRAKHDKMPACADRQGKMGSPTSKRSTDPARR